MVSSPSLKNPCVFHMYHVAMLCVCVPMLMPTVRTPLHTKLANQHTPNSIHADPKVRLHFCSSTLLAKSTIGHKPWKNTVGPRLISFKFNPLRSFTICARVRAWVGVCVCVPVGCPQLEPPCAFLKPAQQHPPTIIPRWFRGNKPASFGKHKIISLFLL